MDPIVEIREVAAGVADWCKGRTTHHEWCGCQIAARLTAAADALSVSEKCGVCGEGFYANARIEELTAENASLKARVAELQIGMLQAADSIMFTEYGRHAQEDGQVMTPKGIAQIEGVAKALHSQADRLVIYEQAVETRAHAEILDSALVEIKAEIAERDRRIAELVETLRQRVSCSEQSWTQPTPKERRGPRRRSTVGPGKVRTRRKEYRKATLR